LAEPGAATAGTGWRGVARSRSREAQEAYDLGRLELDAGRTSSALAHLRRALQLAPGDADVASALQRGG
jgi:Flp pilus assembly protein TadD